MIRYVYRCLNPKCERKSFESDQRAGAVCACGTPGVRVFGAAVHFHPSKGKG